MSSSKTELMSAVLEKVNELKDSASLPKIFRVLSNCDITLHPGLKSYLVNLLNQGGKLNGLPLDAEYFLAFTLPVLV